LATHYEWDYFNLLILPSGAPYGATAHSSIAFVSPSLITGDKSLTFTIAREIAHTWTGHTVTNRDWSNKWLNDGFAMYLQRLAIRQHDDESFADLNVLVGYSELQRDLKRLGDKNSYASLYPILNQDDPINSFSSVSYEKGFHFLFRLQKVLFDDDFFPTLVQQYLKTFSPQSITYTEFIDFYISQVKLKFPDKADEILSGIDWEKWINGTGNVATLYDFSNYWSIWATECRDKLFNNMLPKDFPMVFKGWFTDIKLLFLDLVISRLDKFKEEHYTYLRDALGYKGYNMEVLSLWYQLSLMSKHTDAVEYITDFLGKTGRIKLIRPLYHYWALLDTQRAYNVFNANRKFYHPMAVRLIENDFNNLSIKYLEQ
jgi:leukotriene-A4 hydrolase